MASITPEPAVSGPDETETVGVGAVGVGAVAERPRGMPRSLLIGGGAAALLLVGALFLFGPLRPRALRQPVEGSVAETSPQEGQAEPAAEPGVAEPERQPVAEEVGPAGEVQVAGEVGQPTRPAGPQEAAGEAAEVAAPEAEQTPVAGPPEETPAGEPPEELPAEEMPVERGDPSAAQAALRLAERERDAAAGVVSDEDHGRTLAALNAELTAALAQMEAGRYDEAEQAFSSLVSQYEALAESARNRAAERDRQLAAARDGASRTRQAALEQRQAAIDAGAQRLFPQEFANRERAREAAEQEFRDSSYASARSLFVGLARGYEELAERAGREGTRRELQPRVTTARRAMQQQRQAALDAGAQQHASDSLATVDGIARRAEAELRNERYAEALPLFQQAAEAYAQLAEELAAQPVEEERPAEERPAEAEQPSEEVPAESEEAVVVSAEEAIADLIGTFCKAFEEEDLDRIRDEVYKGEMPRGNNRRDAQFLRTLFESVEELSVDPTVEGIRVDGTSAVAAVRLSTRFREARMRTRGDRDFRLRLEFASTPGGWRLQRLEWR